MYNTEVIQILIDSNHFELNMKFSNFRKFVSFIVGFILQKLQFSV